MRKMFKIFNLVLVIIGLFIYIKDYREEQEFNGIVEKLNNGIVVLSDIDEMATVDNDEDINKLREIGLAMNIIAKTNNMNTDFAKSIAYYIEQYLQENDGDYDRSIYVYDNEEEKAIVMIVEINRDDLELEDEDLYAGCAVTGEWIYKNLRHLYKGTDDYTWTFLLKTDRDIVPEFWYVNGKVLALRKNN